MIMSGNYNDKIGWDIDNLKKSHNTKCLTYTSCTSKIQSNQS